MIIERNTCSEEFQLAGLTDMPMDMFSRPLSTDNAPLSYDDNQQRRGDIHMDE